MCLHVALCGMVLRFVLFHPFVVRRLVLGCTVHVWTCVFLSLVVLCCYELQVIRSAKY